MTTQWVIYCHTHIESERRYVGLTKKTMLQRWNAHVLDAKRTTGKGCLHFWNAIRKYGPQAFSHDVLEACDNVVDANFREAQWIGFLDTRNPEKGFNLMRGGGHTPHPIKNPWDRPEYRAKLIIAVQMKAADPNWRAKISSSMKVVASDPDWKKNKSERAIQQWSRPELRALHSALWQDPDYVERCGASLRRSASAQSAKTHCPHDHPFSNENTGISIQTIKGVIYSGRVCKTCVRLRRRGQIRSKQKVCECGVLIKKSSNRCFKCNSRSKLGKNERITWPPFKELQTVVRLRGYGNVAKQLGVSYQAVRMKLKRLTQWQEMPA